MKQSLEFWIAGKAQHDAYAEEKGNGEWCKCLLWWWPRGVSYPRRARKIGNGLLEVCIGTTPKGLEKFNDIVDNKGREV